MRAVLLGVLATAAFVSATGTNCANNNLEDLISRTSCGCSKKLSKCLATGVDLTRADQVQECLISSGCKEADAITEASWFAKECHGTENSGPQAELRRRKGEEEETTSAEKKGGKTSAVEKTTAEDEETSTEAAQKTTKEAKTTAEAETTAEPESTTAPSTAEASTTAAEPTSTADESTTASASTPTQTTSEPTTASTVSAQTQTTGTTTTPLQCSVTNMITTSVCSISKGKTISCTPTITASATCAPGVICQIDVDGRNICMRKDNHLTNSGIAVTIIFIFGILGATIAIIITSYKSNAAIKKREAERVALLGFSKNGKGRAVVGDDVEAVKPYARGNKNPSEAHVPLIGSGPQRTEQAYYTAPDYFNAAGGSNSVSPGTNEGRAAPKLHPGLGALGQNY